MTDRVKAALANAAGTAGKYPECTEDALRCTAEEVLRQLHLRRAAFGLR